MPNQDPARQTRQAIINALHQAETGGAPYSTVDALAEDARAVLFDEAFAALGRCSPADWHLIAKALRNYRSHGGGTEGRCDQLHRLERFASRIGYALGRHD